MALELNNYSPLLNDANLISYYRLEGNSNDVKTTNNGTDTNITYNSSYGKFGQGATFNGTSSQIVLGTGFNTALTSNNWSINLWLKPTAVTASDFFVANDNNTGTRQFAFGYGFDISGADVTTGQLYFEKGGVPTLASTGAVLTTSYQIVTVTYDGTNLKTYINGSPNSTTAMTPMASSANSLYLGRRQYTGTPSKWYTGDMDDVSFYSRTLTATEILNYYNAIMGSGFFNFF